MEENNRIDTGRNQDGTFKQGISGNPKGRPRNTMKDFLKRKFSEMDDWEKEEWLEKNNVSAELQWQMAEGRPHQDTDITTDGKELPMPIIKVDVSGNDGD
jgi:hypothetical protein